MPNEHEQEKKSEIPVGKNARLMASEYHWLLDWVVTLETVFFSGATLCSFMRWCAAGNAWDIGGALFSGGSTWVSYRFALSENSLYNVRYRKFLTFGLPLFWGVFFPVLMTGLGFK